MTLTDAQINLMFGNYWDYISNPKQWKQIPVDYNYTNKRFYNFASKHIYTRTNLSFLAVEFMRTGKTPVYLTKNQINALSQEKKVFLTVPERDKQVILYFPEEKKIYDKKTGKQMFYKDANGVMQPQIRLNFKFFYPYSVDDIPEFDKTWLEDDIDFEQAYQEHIMKYKEWVRERLAEDNASFTIYDYENALTQIENTDDIKKQNELIDKMYEGIKQKQAFNSLVRELTLFMLNVEVGGNLNIHESAEYIRGWSSGLLKDTTGNVNVDTQTSKNNLYKAMTFASRRCENILKLDGLQ